MRSQETQLENLMHKVGSSSKMRESSRPIVVLSYDLGERWGYISRENTLLFM